MFYIHNVPGRIRIKTPCFKNNSGAADEIRKALSTIRGIGTVDINLTTGSILINYNPKETCHKVIARLLEDRGLFDRSKAITNDEYFKKKVTNLIEPLLMSVVGALVLVMLFLLSVFATCAMAEESKDIQADKRISTLARIIKNIADNGVTADEAIVISRTLNSHNNPPLSDDDVAVTVKRVYNNMAVSEEDNGDPAALPENKVESLTDGEQSSQRREEGLPSWAPKVLGLQFNGIYQNVPGFRSPYAGDHSFRVDGGRGHNITHIYGVYLGSQLASTLQAYVDIEMAKGSGVSKGQGLGGYTNGDVIRVGSVDLGTGPYVARAYLRYFYPLSNDMADVERGQDQLPGKEPASRFEVKAGKVSVADDFDLNRYANNTRTQFFNYSFINNTAWDYAADTRGYTYGFVVSLFKPAWRLAFGSYTMMTIANGATVDRQFFKSQGNNLELTLRPNDIDTVIRVLAYFNEGRMGSYAQAIAIGSDTSSVPDVRANEIAGRTKYGFGLNLEQPLADKGETGIFGRLGWNDGHNETFAYTEVDRTASLGFQVNGAHWGRDVDQVGIAYAIDGLSSDHKDYLAAGGLGMLLGDGKLNYGLEQILEAYYRIQIGKYVQVSPDFQRITNPGYNRDRGPANVYSMRLRVAY